MRLWDLCWRGREGKLSEEETLERDRLQAVLGEVDVAAVPGGVRAMSESDQLSRRYHLIRQSTPSTSCTDMATPLGYPSVLLRKRRENGSCRFSSRPWSGKGNTSPQPGSSRPGMHAVIGHREQSYSSYSESKPRLETLGISQTHKRSPAHLPLSAISYRTSCFPSQSACTPSSRIAFFQLILLSPLAAGRPSMMLMKWLPASWPSFELNEQLPYATRISASEYPPGYHMYSPTLGCDVWFSNFSPKSCSPCGIHRASPDHRTWMCGVVSGSREVNVWQVLGAASVWSRARKMYDGVCIRIRLVPLLVLMVDGDGLCWMDGRRQQSASRMQAGFQYRHHRLVGTKRAWRGEMCRNGSLRPILPEITTRDRCRAEPTTSRCRDNTTHPCAADIHNPPGAHAS